MKRKMTKDLQAIKLPGKITRSSWTLPKNLPEDQWIKFGQFFNHIEVATQWWIGDWWAYGEHAYGDRKALFKEGGPLEGMSFKTCATYGYVARNVTTSTRVEVLSFKHHRIVATLPPTQQRKWLERAAKEEWSIRELMNKINPKENDDEEEEEDKEEDDNDDIEDEIEEKNLKTAFLARMGHVVQFLVYKGPINDEVIRAARAVVEASHKLLDQLERKYDNGNSKEQI
jgi:hypothetical protein